MKTKLSPRVAAGVHRGRTLNDCHFLTVNDWGQIFDAYLAFRYQVRLVVDRAEAKARPENEER